MTIASAWIRSNKDSQELVVASDSRLSCGNRMDCCQKVYMLPRADSFICFAGGTEWAFPMIHQVVSAISTSEKASTRALDITKLKTEILHIFESLRKFVHSGETQPIAEFIFGGYSWMHKCFKIWRIFYQEGVRRFEAAPAKCFQGSQNVFVGDFDHVGNARKKLSALLKLKKNRSSGEPTKLDWEPLEVIRDMLREVDNKSSLHKTSSIGGALQVLKIYEYPNTVYFGVDWEIKQLGINKTVFHCGREVTNFHSRKPAMWIIDPDTLESRHSLY